MAGKETSAEDSYLLGRGLVASGRSVQRSEIEVVISSYTKHSKLDCIFNTGFGTVV